MDDGLNSTPSVTPPTAAPRRSALARASLILGGVSLGMFCCTIGLGAAISLLFGLLSSTILTVLVIPAIYRVLRT